LISKSIQIVLRP